MAQAGLQAALPREMYVDEQTWQAEREKVLFGQWYCLGRVVDLGLDQPERVVTVDVVGESVLVTRDQDGRLHASYNVCRHRGAQVRPLDAGSEDAGVACSVSALRCPYHSWTYGLDGRLLRAPHTDLGGHDLDEFRLAPVGVEVWAGFVFVHLTPQHATPLPQTVVRVATTLANYGLEDLVTGARMTYDVAANYKVLLENYNECYHCGPVHPELCRLVPAFAGGGSDLTWEDGVPHREGTWTFTATGTSTRSALPGLTDQERTRHKGELAYPNLLLSASADHVAALVLSPLAVDRTRVDCSLLFAADEVADARFDPSDARDFWDLVNRQDWAVCESVQRGMSSRSYVHGWFAPMEDESVDIRRWLLPLLEES